MGGHDIKLPPIPDWRTYKLEDAPELMKLKEDLEARGLRNPWLRNEVWRYITKDRVVEASFMSKFKFMMGGGFKYGVGAAIITIIAEKAYFAYLEKNNPHHDDHH